MEALAIVTCTLLGFAALLFGSDSLDRRLAARAYRLLAESALPRDRVPAPADAQRAAALASAPGPASTDVIEAAILSGDSVASEPAAA